MSIEPFHLNPLGPEDYWRAVILQGKNTASYKFALAQSLLDLSPQQGHVVKLEDLAPIYAQHLVDHVKKEPKQTTGKTGKLLQACQDFAQSNISETQLVDVTIKEGFKYVLDAFHVVGNQSIEKPFFVKSSAERKAIEITEHFDALRESTQLINLEQELQSRWRLVESAWSMNLATHLIGVEYDHDSQLLYVKTKEVLRRKNITSSRGALNGYQLGRCFYCFDEINLNHNTDVDHFFPHKLGQYPRFRQYNLDGIWNLVLACEACNRGNDGKFALLPAVPLLNRLHKRNEHLVTSHHPLRETLIRQTGRSARDRQAYLGELYRQARSTLLHAWEPKILRGKPCF